MIREFIKRLLGIRPLTSEEYINNLRIKGIKIGGGTIAFSPSTIQIDISRPELLEIGEHVFLHKGTIIMTHDWASWCFVHSDARFYPSHAKIKIGNNVWLGENVTICKGVTIGDNCIIGIGSVVTKSIPPNSIAAGIPARVICSYEEYMKKRSQQYVDEAIEYANAILDSGREPKIEDFYDDYPCFVDGENYMDYNYPYSRIFTPNLFEQRKKHHKKIFNGFDDFIQQVKNKRIK